ncbi:MAG: polysaccharide pyruvyl transferase family protein [Lachnospiraceae bacterium]|nr:polysaccharide pyruvyl transferase family protein [Lachnospiraceae bacterium]
MSRKKTGIVSCYFIHNYGSMLQSYATQMILDKMNIENETINVSGFIKQLRKKQYSYILYSGFKSGLLKDRFWKATDFIVKKLVKNEYSRNIVKRDCELDRFVNCRIRKSEIYSSIEDLKEKCSYKYDSIIVGSDQLWLPANIAADYYTLNFVPHGMNSIAYATSFGVSSLPKDASEMARTFLPRINHISVREKTGQDLIKDLTGRIVPIVCDPTLLLTDKEWLSIQKPNPIYEEPYIFCYFISNDRKRRQFARRLADRIGTKVVALPHVDHYVKLDEDYADFTPYQIGPEDFINLIKNSNYVCTDSFHGTVFSILYQKEFFNFKRYTKETKQSTNSRLEALHDLIGITDRMFSGEELVDDCTNKTIDYASVNEKLMAARIDAFDYLRKSFENLGSTDIS